MRPAKNRTVRNARAASNAAGSGGGSDVPVSDIGVSDADADGLSEGVDGEAPSSGGSPALSDSPDGEHEADSTANTATSITVLTADSAVTGPSWQLPWRRDHCWTPAPRSPPTR